MRWLLAALLLSACSAVPGYEDYKMATSGYVDQAIVDRQQFNDKKRMILDTLVCDMSLGAYARMPPGDLKKGVALICGLNVNP